MLCDENRRPAPAPAFQAPPPFAQYPSNSQVPIPRGRNGKPKEILDSSFVGKSGGEIFHEMMLRHNVKHVFGYPGGAILPVFDAIYNSKYFDFVLPRHEQGAGHMAEGYARASGKPGVVLVTSGPVSRLARIAGIELIDLDRALQMSLHLCKMPCQTVHLLSSSVVK